MIMTTKLGVAGSRTTTSAGEKRRMVSDMYIGVELILVLMATILLWMTVVIVRPTHRAIIERFGKYHRFVEPGITFKIPGVDYAYEINVTEQMVDAEPQDIITQDNLNARVDAQIYFKVQSDEKNVKNSQYNVDNYKRQIVALARTTLRDVIGKLSFKEINSMRNKLNKTLADELGNQTQAWGIDIIRTELKQIEPPEDVQVTMNKVIKAENEKIAATDFATAVETQADGERRAMIKQADGAKQSKVLVAEGEAQAIKLVNEAAQQYFKDQAVELKKLETFQVAFADNVKIIVPNDQPVMDILAKMLVMDTTKLSKKKVPAEKKEMSD